MQLYLSSHLQRYKNRIDQAKNLDAAIDAFVANQSAEAYHEVISQYNELARTPMNFKLLDKVQDTYIPEGVQFTY